LAHRLCCLASSSKEITDPGVAPFGLRHALDEVEDIRVEEPAGFVVDDAAAVSLSAHGQASISLDESGKRPVDHACRIAALYPGANLFWSRKKATVRLLAGSEQGKTAGLPNVATDNVLGLQVLADGVDVERERAGTLFDELPQGGKLVLGQPELLQHDAQDAQSSAQACCDVFVVAVNPTTQARRRRPDTNEQGLAAIEYMLPDVIDD
jgi:hypothetical protein